MTEQRTAQLHELNTYTGDNLWQDVILLPTKGDPMPTTRTNPSLTAERVADNAQALLRDVRAGRDADARETIELLRQQLDMLAQEVGR